MQFGRISVNGKLEVAISTKFKGKCKVAKYEEKHEDMNNCTNLDDQTWKRYKLFLLWREKA